MWVYKRRRRRFIFSLIIILLLFSIGILAVRFRLIFVTLCKSRIQLVSQQIANDVITDKLDILGQNLLEFQKNDRGEIVFVNANVIYMNKLANEISVDISEQIDKLGYLYVNVPIGSLSGSDILTSSGPSLKIKFIPVGDVKTEFKTDFSSTGINQSKHKVFINVTCQVKALSIFADTLVNTNLQIPILETVIVGGVPSTYYHLEGLEYKDSLNLFN